MQDLTLTDFDPSDPTVAAADVIDVRALARREVGASGPDVAVLRLTTTINTTMAYVRIGELWAALKTEVDRRKAYFTPRKARAHAVWTDWLEAEHESIDGLVADAKHAANLVGAYDSEQRRIAEETRRQLEVAARATADADQLMAALDADADGAIDIAAEILAEAPMVSHQSVAIQTPVVNGMSTTGRWKATLAVDGNIDKLILAAADEIRTKKARIAASMLKADQTAINKAATALKGNLRLMAGTLGLSVFEDRTPRRR